ncbi:hypothetical protein [Kumtagia ephedrae]|uniref:hypothetical protein n=1 Tax=Kumtagia ephedrae TaxID=2116701 RepID=UPI001401D9D3|nr:hypothetical protein [Mesorhizobium ephedrae]
MLKDGTCYQDLGVDHFARGNRQRQVERLASRIRFLGFAVGLRPAARHPRSQISF